jgi:hypothetical protein
MSSNKKQKTQQNECVSPDTNLPSSSSSSAPIPEDIIREYILPYMVHLKQVDDVVKKIEEDAITRTRTRRIIPRNIGQILLECINEGESSVIHYIYSIILFVILES